MTETIDTRGAKQLASALENYAMTDDAWAPTLTAAATELRNLHAANLVTSYLCTQAQEDVTRLTSALAAAEARIATLTDDAARLDFMCNKPARFIDVEDGGWWRVYEDHAPPEEPHAQWRAIVTKHEQTPRAAIDAAIQARAAASISTKEGDGHAEL